MSRKITEKLCRMRFLSKKTKQTFYIDIVIHTLNSPHTLWIVWITPCITQNAHKT